MKRLFLSLFILAISLSFGNSDTAFASKSNQIDDAIYYDYNSMSEAQIANWISSNFPNSCLLSSNYPAEYSNNSAWRNTTFKEPLSYFTYGGQTSPARIIWNASQFYSLNPRVILTTLEKESDLVTGSKGCSAWRYNSAMGYNCPTGAEEFLKDYPNLGIYDTCVQTESYAGFSPQVNKAAWQLSFDGKRANGDLSWMGDGNVTYYGRMTQGYRARVSGGAQSYYDGYTTINGESVYLENGPTAALYNYTPFFTRFETIYTGWFGSTHTNDYAWQPVSQASYVDQTKTVTLNTNQMVIGNAHYFVIKAKNTGNLPWKKGVPGQQVNLGTQKPMDRRSSFCDGTWLNDNDCNRIVTTVENEVLPGQTGTFEFWMKSSKTGTFNEYFNLVADGTTWLNDPGLYWTLKVEPKRYAWQPVGQQHFTDNTKTIPAITGNLAKDQRYYLVIRAKNIGNQTWRKGVAGAQVNVGTSQNMDRRSGFCDTTWLNPTNCNRVATTIENEVLPGQIGTFEFWVNTPDQTGTYKEYFNLVADGTMWLNDPGLYWTLRVASPNYAWQPVSQESYVDQTKTTVLNTNQMTLGNAHYFIIKAKNVGNETWKKGVPGQQVNLGTQKPMDRRSSFCDSTWLNSSNCNRVVTTVENDVLPGQVGTFEFWLKSSKTGTFNEYFNLVADGTMWLNDPGLYWTLRVNP